MEMKLYKKTSKYIDKENKEKTATEFFLKLGDKLIPIEIKFFKNKETGQDKAYSGRKLLMSTFAENLPEKA